MESYRIDFHRLEPVVLIDGDTLEITFKIHVNDLGNKEFKAVAVEAFVYGYKRPLKRAFKAEGRRRVRRRRKS